METIIGRCSLCSGDVVKDMGAYYETPKARCLSCGATEAPPDVVIQMRKPQDDRLTQILKQGYGEALQKKLQDAVSKQELPANRDLHAIYRKPCPHCQPIPMGGQLTPMHVIDYGQYSGNGQPSPHFTTGADSQAVIRI